MKRITVGLFAVFAFGAIARGGDDRGITIRVKNDKGADTAIRLYSASHALLLGVSHYAPGGNWPDLSCVPGELDAVESALKRHHFTITRVTNPDGQALRRAFDDFINDYGMDVNNRLLFVYSGHGYSLRNGAEGFLVPADAPDPRDDEKGFRRKALSMSDILAGCRRMQAKHALFLFDSCFSGAMFKTKSLPEIPPTITLYTTKPVRQFITAGSEKEQVPAQSVFVPTLLKALRKGSEADYDKDGFVTGTELGMFLRNKVIPYGMERGTPQTPQYGKMRDPDFDEGDFVFDLASAESEGTTDAAKPGIEGPTPMGLSPAPFSLTLAERRAEASFISRDYAAAFDAYIQLSDSAPTNINHHRRIEECARLGRLQKTFLDHYLALEKRQPGNAIFHNYLGNAFLMLDPRDTDGKAREHYEAALRLDPKLNLPLANMGILAYRSGRTNDAQVLFQRYLSAYPDDAQGWVNLGILYTAGFGANTNDTRLAQQAEQAFRRALRVDPGSAPAYKGLGHVFETGRRKRDALNAYQRSLVLNYDQPDVRQQVELLAWESAGDRNPALQLDDLKTRAVNGDVRQAPPIVAAARLLDEQRFQEAVQVCLAWTKGEPDNPLAYHLLARAYDGDRQTDAASKAHAETDRLIAKQAQSP